VVAEKTGDARERYNRASRLAAAASRALSASFGKDFDHLAAAVRELDPAELRSALLDTPDGEFTPQDLVDRFDQFVLESEDIIPEATKELGNDDMEKFGHEAERSQIAGARLLKNQVEQTVWLADRATQLGASGASAFGAGFGGSVWALVAESEIPEFVDRWKSDYLSRYPSLVDSAKFLITRPGPAAFEIKEGLL
jgi:galactokinase